MNFKIEWFDKLTSTNTYMHEQIKHGADPQHGHLIVAREQTAGRGRQNRKWISEAHKNLYFSLFIKTDADLIQVPSLTMAVALGINAFLHDMNIPSAPKWPNDLLVNKRKICGILSERVDQKGIIIGIGLNINMTSMDTKAIDQPATSILIETQDAHPLPSILEKLLPFLDHWIKEWEQGGFLQIKDEWIQQAGPIGKSISIHDGILKKSGQLAGFGPHGELLLETNHGIEPIWSGDLSL